MRRILGVLLAIGVVLTIVAIYPLVTSPDRGTSAALPMAGGGTTYTEATPTGSFLPPAERKPVPAIAFADGEGRDATLEQFRGQVVVLNLWATWCGPCVREMPSLDALQAKLGGAGFAVVALSQDRGGLEVVKTFFAEQKLANLRIWLDKGNAAGRALKTRGLPTTLVVDAEGREVARVEGAAEWDSPQMVEQLKKVTAGG